MIMYVRYGMDGMLPVNLGQYEAMMGYMTPDERKELREWVADGNATICNPWYMAGEDGRPLDYITAVRINEDICRNPEAYGIETYEDTCDYCHVDDELPF